MNKVRKASATIERADEVKPELSLLVSEVEVGVGGEVLGVVEVVGGRMAVDGPARVVVVGVGGMKVAVGSSVLVLVSEGGRPEEPIRHLGLSSESRKH